MKVKTPKKTYNMTTKTGKLKIFNIRKNGKHILSFGKLSGIHTIYFAYSSDVEVVPVVE